MKRQELIQVLKLATSKEFEPIAYLSEEMSVFSGCALDNKRRVVTRKQVASLLVGHCYTFAGTWDFKEFDELTTLSKRFDLAD